MADTSTDTGTGTVDDALLQQLIQQSLAPPPTAAPQTSSREGRGFVSLLGEALGGGQQTGTSDEREQGGLRALQSFGMNMLLNSGYRNTPLTLGQVIATGMGGAQQSIGESEQRAASQQA